MTSGHFYAGGILYAHLKDCAVLEAKLQREREEAQRAQREALWKRKANLPAGEDDLSAYQARFPVTADTRHGVALCEAFVKASREAVPGHGFTLRGFQGTGKTTLIVAFCRSLLALGIEVRFERAPELYNRLLQASRDDRLDSELKELRRPKVLVLDDLGREKPTPWWVDQVLFPIVDFRYGQNRPVVTTTNYEWPALEELYASARNEREQAHSASQLVDRLQHKCAAVRFGGEQSKRMPEWDFMPKKGSKA